MAVLTSYQPSVNDVTLTQNVPLANVRPANQFSPELFVDIPNVPIFAEHETTCTAGKYAGRKLLFDYSALLAVADRCNRRINETGDYAAITIGHTPPKELVWEGKAKMPEVVGMAGPFRMGQLAMPDGQRKWAILCDFHIFREDADKLKKYPRRSPELWLEERYDDMFLDPIALLSAEAPRLDMGMLYCRREIAGSRLVEVYSAAAAPAAASVFVPSFGAKTQQYAGHGGSVMALSPEDVKQVVDALMQTEPMQFVVSLMAQGGDPNGQPPGAPPGAAPPGAPPGADMQQAGADPNAAAGAPLPGGPGSGPLNPTAAAPPAAPPTMPPGAAAGQMPPKQYAGDDKDDFLADEDEPDEEPALASDDDDMPPPPPKKSKKDYAGADCNGVKVQSKKRADEMYAANDDNLVRRLRALEGRLQIEQYARVNAERREWFAERSAEGYGVDVGAEMEICAADQMGPDQFEKYAAHFLRTRANAPLNVTLPYTDAKTGDTNPSAGKMRVVNGRPEVSQYSLAHSERAFQICSAKANAGEHVSYEAVLADVVAGKL